MHCDFGLRIMLYDARHSLSKQQHMQWPPYRSDRKSFNFTCMTTVSSPIFVSGSLEPHLGRRSIWVTEKLPLILQKQNRNQSYCERAKLEQRALTTDKSDNRQTCSKLKKSNCNAEAGGIIRHHFLRCL